MAQSIAATASLASTLTLTVTKTLSPSTSASSTNRAAPQGGIFEGANPTHYDTKNPIVLFIIQATLVIAFTRILHWPLSKLRQPRVIAEVITGIILGPSVMGRIPGFTAHIFPTASMPAFTLAANLGLVLFLFIVGLEVDLRYLISNWRIALSVGAAGMAIPFGLGVAIAWGLYHEFRSDKGIVPIGFGIYALFIGVALAITAFPVLCRILTSLKLLSTPVGVIVLSAGVGNDVVGWVLLALCVALVNSSAGLTALWIVLTGVGYCLFLGFVIRPVFLWILRRTKSLENGPTQGVVALTILLVLASAFFTSIIGIHPIFGAFMIGLICPHEGGFAIKLTEKIEDLVSTLFLPLYFALSGLSTNLGLLNNGTIWGYVVAVTAIAFIGKITGGTLASRLNGLVWRESFTIGCLMSCKGLVELIVLNIGLQAGILSSTTFTIFVVMALVTTFATTPLVVWLYPPWYQEKLELWKKGKINWDGTARDVSDGSITPELVEDVEVANRMVVYLRTDALSSLFAIISLFTGSKRPTQEKQSTGSLTPIKREHGKSVLNSIDIPMQSQRPLRIHGLRLTELTERNSSVMRVGELEEYAIRDPIIKAFGSTAFSTARDVTVSGQIAVVPDNSFANTLVQRTTSTRSQFLLVPWSETGSISEVPPSTSNTIPINDAYLLDNREYSDLVQDIFREAIDNCAVGVFVHKSLIGNTSRLTRVPSIPDSPTFERPRRQLSRTMTGVSLSEHNDAHFPLFRSSDTQGAPQIRVLYTGSADDVFAVRLALQMARNGNALVKVLICLNAKSTSSRTSVSESQEARERLQATLPDEYRLYVEFVDVDQNALEHGSCLDGDSETEYYRSRNTTIIVGRADQNADGTASALYGDTSVLGNVADRLIHNLRQDGRAANVLVVQSKRSMVTSDDRVREGGSEDDK